MTDRLFRRLERLQKLDDALRRAQRSKSDPREIARLHILKSALKLRLMQLTARRAPAFG
ncbi:DUF465 domain-containing protein [Croceicoccus bisphenolivorans]|uniref:DUF465 domain-containing protein n=1 Tax=Croceicoccus bisphenolivorans TaxID=1783232 RepID=UPI0012E72379|nr:DUF465 domain-containing protein [Croceicoccus bisphenolivorans]